MNSALYAVKKLVNSLIIKEPFHYTIMCNSKGFKSGSEPSNAEGAY